MKTLRRCAGGVGQVNKKRGASPELGVDFDAAAGVFYHALDHKKTNTRAFYVIMEALKQREANRFALPRAFHDAKNAGQKAGISDYLPGPSSVLPAKPASSP